MELLSGNIGGLNFPNMIRGHFYSFTYINLESDMKNSLVLNPIIVFSAIDKDRRIHGLNMRVLRNPYIFVEDYQNFYYKNGIINEMISHEHKYAFSFRVIKSLFNRNPDIQSAWRLYDPSLMKYIKDINIGETIKELGNKNKVHNSNMGVI